MLPSIYEFHLDNKGDASCNMTFTVTPWKFDANGALEYGTPISRNGAIGPGTDGIVGTNITNTEYLGAHVECSFGGGGTGTLTAYFMITGADQLTMAIASISNPASATLIVGAEI